MRAAIVAAVFASGLGCQGELEAGHAAWTAGETAQARARWLAVTEDGSASAEIWYNLGNAWHADGDLPRAVAAWRTARVLQPRNSDASHNLAIARGELKGLPEPMPNPVGWTEFVTPAELAGVAALVLAAMSTWWWVHRNRTSKHQDAVGVALLALGLSLAGVAAQGQQEQSSRAIAVVVDAPAALRDAPLPQAPVLSELPPGSEVLIESASGPFLLVRAGDGRAGFVAAGSVMLATPDSR